MEEKIIIYDDIKIEKIKFTGVDSTGKEYHADAYIAPDYVKGYMVTQANYGEDSLRYKLATHKRCECGNLMLKYYTKCDDCRNKKDNEKYFSLPIVPFVDFPLCTYNDDKMFFDSDSLYDYLSDIEIENLDSIQLTPCLETKVPTIDLIEEISERMELSDDFTIDDCLGVDDNGDSIYDLNRIVNESLLQMYEKGNKYYNISNKDRVLLSSVIDIDKYILERQKEEIKEFSHNN